MAVNSFICQQSLGGYVSALTWRFAGSIFEGSVSIHDGQVIPTITGEAWVMAEGQLLVDERDPFKDGIWI